SVLMFVLGFPTVIANFFVGRDLLQLVLAPVRPAEIFIARAVLAMLANLLISSLLLAGALGIGIGSSAPPAYYLLALLLVITQVLVVTAFQALLMSLVLRWIPPRLARDVAAGVAGLTGAGFYVAWNVNLRQSFESRTRPDLAGVTTFIQNAGWLPPTWPAHALSGAIEGNPGMALGWAGLTLAFAAVLATAAGLLYGRTLLAGLGVFGGVPVMWRRSRQRSQAVARAGTGSPLQAIARKDWLAYRRDIRRLTRLLPALLFPVGYVFAFSRPSRTLNGFWSEVFLVAFISMFMSTTLGTPSIPSERRGFQLLRMSPLPMWQLLRAKVALTLPAVLLLTTAFGIVVALVERNEVAQIVELTLLAVWLGVGFVSIGVSAGAIDPRFESTDDRRAVGLVGTLAGVGGALGFGALSVGAFALLVFAGGVAAGTVHIEGLP
ncbi:MAG: putative ABC transporter permease subunit, partial [Candidatus Dormibacteraceae bacterium]